MKVTHFNAYFFFFVLIGVGIMMFLILQPFLTAILAAAILAALCQGWYQWMVKKTHNRYHLSALLTLFLIAAIIIVPLITVFGIAINEAALAYDRVAAGDVSGQMFVSSFVNKLQALPYASVWLPEQSFDAEHIVDTVKSFGQNILGFAQTLYHGVVNFILWLFVMFFSLFYFLIDGKKMVKYFMGVTPLRDEHEKLLIDKFVSMSRATLRGTLMVSIVQGVLGGIMFAIVGVPSPTIWGMVMTVMSVIPLVGAGIVWFPAAMILLFMGQIWQGVAMLAFGIGVVSTIDNVLRPKLVGRDTQMHPLMIFFATLGGIAFFGFPGFIIGPIVASLFLSLIDIYALEFKTQLKSYNE